MDDDGDVDDDDDGDVDDDDDDDDDDWKYDCKDLDFNPFACSCLVVGATLHNKHRN